MAMSEVSKSVGFGAFMGNILKGVLRDLRVAAEIIIPLCTFGAILRFRHIAYRLVADGDVRGSYVALVVGRMYRNVR